MKFDITWARKLPLGVAPKMLPNLAWKQIYKSIDRILNYQLYYEFYYENEYSKFQQTLQW